MSKRSLICVTVALALLVLAWMYWPSAGVSRESELKADSGAIESAAVAIQGTPSAPSESPNTRVVSGAGADSRAPGPAPRATLALVAVAKETGEVLTNAKFEIVVERPNSDLEVDRSSAASDGQGRADFEVEAGRPINVSASLTVEPRSSTDITVPALSAGEHREVRIELTIAPGASAELAYP